MTEPETDAWEPTNTSDWMLRVHDLLTEVASLTAERDALERAVDLLTTDRDEVRACLSKCIAENGFEHYCHVDLAELLMDAAVETEPRIVHYEEPIAAGEQVRLCRLEAGHEGDHDYAWVTEVELT